MGDLNGLIKSLKEEIAIAGQNGATVQQIIHEIKAFYQRKTGDQDKSSARIQNVDRAFQERAWSWLIKDPIVRSNKNDEAKILSLAEIEALEPPIRLYTTEQQIWITLTGHEKDVRKIPGKMFELLEIVASRKGQGITQPELVKLTGQDKRSVPMRTQRLADAGLVKKIPVLANHSNTSLIVHTRFLNEFETPAAGEQITATLVSEVGPDRLFLGHNRFVRVEKEIRDAVAVLEENEGLLMWYELKKKIDVADGVTSKLLAEGFRRLEELGVTARVRASAGSKRLNASTTLHRCIKLLRPPTEHDWRSLFEWTKQEQNKLTIDVPPWEHFHDDLADKDLLPLASQSRNKIPNQFHPAQDLHVPTWSPDRLLIHSIRSALLSATTTGLSTKDLKKIVVGPCYIRPIDRLLDRCVWRWQESQPFHLRHLSIIRDSAQVGKTSFYVHFVHDAFGIKVENRETLWEAVQSFPEDEEAAVYDEYGFAAISASKFSDVTKSISLSMALESAVNGNQAREADEIVTGVESKADRSDRGQVVIWSQKPRNRLPTVGHKEPQIHIGRPRKYPDPRAEVDITAMCPEEAKKILTSQQRAQQYLRNKAHKWVEDRMALGISQSEAEATVIAELGLTPESYAANTIRKLSTLEKPRSNATKRRKQSSMGFQYLPSIAAHTISPPCFDEILDSPARKKRQTNKRQGEGLLRRGYLPSVLAHTQPLPEQKARLQSDQEMGMGDSGVTEQDNTAVAVREQIEPLSEMTTTVAVNHVEQPMEVRTTGGQGYSLPVDKPNARLVANPLASGSLETRGVSPPIVFSTAKMNGSVAPKSGQRHSIGFLPPVTGLRENYGYSRLSATANIFSTIQGNAYDEQLDLDSNQEITTTRSEISNDNAVNLSTPAADEPRSENLARNVVLEGNSGLPFDTPGGSPSKPSEKKSQSVRMAPFGGTIAAMRRLIILEIVNKAGGAFPGDGELAYPFLTAYVKKFPDAKPDNKTIKIAKTTLVGEGKLKQIFFNYKSASGIVQMRSIIALPDISDTDPRIQELQQHMAKTYPHPYFPPGTDIRDDLMPKAASYNTGTISKLRLGQYSNELPVVSDLVVRQYSTKKPKVSASKETSVSEVVSGTEGTVIEGPTPKVTRKRKRKTENSEVNQNKLDRTGIDSNAAVTNGNISSQPEAYQLATGSTKRDEKRRQEPINLLQQISTVSVGDTVDAALRHENPQTPAAVSNTEPRNNQGETIAKQDKLSAVSSNLDGVTEGTSADLLQLQAPRPKSKRQNRKVVGKLPNETENVEAARLKELQLQQTQSTPQKRNLPSESTRIVGENTVSRSPRASDDIDVQISQRQADQVTSEQPLRKRRKTLKAATVDEAREDLQVPGSSDIPDEPLNGEALINTELQQQTLQPLRNHRKRNSGGSPETPPRKRRQRRSATQLMARPSALEVLAQLDEATPGVRYSKGQDSQSRPIVTRRARYQWDLQDDRKLFIATLLGHIALGGIREENHWAIVSRMLGHKYDRELCRRRWTPVRARYRTEIEVVSAELRTAFLNSYESGEVPKIDYSNFWDNDWTGIMTWAVNKIDHPDVKDIELPSTREAFEAAFITQDFPEHESPDFLESKRPTSVPTRLGVLNAGPRVIYESPSKSVSELELAKTFVKANILTPQETYDPQFAKEKLSRFSSTVIDGAINDLQNDRIISSTNKGLALPTRAFDMAAYFLRAIQWKLSVGHFKYASAFKEILDRKLKNDGKIEYKSAFGNGEMITMLNLLADNMISLEGKNVPNAKFGLTKEGYKTRTMDKAVYNFDVFATPTEVYSDGLPPRPFPPIPTDIRSSRKHEIADDRIPLWVDINGDVSSIMWDFALAAVATMLTVYTAAGAEKISERLQPCIADFEVQLIMQWLVDAGVAEWKDGAHDVLNLRSYWWSLITTPIGKGAPSDEVVMIAGEPLQ